MTKAKAQRIFGHHTVLLVESHDHQLVVMTTPFQNGKASLVIAQTTINSDSEVLFSDIVPFKANTPTGYAELRAPAEATIRATLTNWEVEPIVIAWRKLMSLEPGLPEYNRTRPPVLLYQQGGEHWSAVPADV